MKEGKPPHITLTLNRPPDYSPISLEDIISRHYTVPPEALIPPEILKNIARRLEMATMKYNSRDERGIDNEEPNPLVLGSVPPPFIDVLKDLPKLNEPVLALNEEGKMLVAFLSVDNNRTSLTWWSDSEVCTIYNIIGWMPLPLIHKSYFTEKKFRDY